MSQKPNKEHYIASKKRNLLFLFSSILLNRDNNIIEPINRHSRYLTREKPQTNQARDQKPQTTQARDQII